MTSDVIWWHESPLLALRLGLVLSGLVNITHTDLQQMLNSNCQYSTFQPIPYKYSLTMHGHWSIHQWYSTVFVVKKPLWFIYVLWYLMSITLNNHNNARKIKKIILQRTDSLAYCVSADIIPRSPTTVLLPTFHILTQTRNPELDAIHRVLNTSALRSQSAVGIFYYTTTLNFDLDPIIRSVRSSVPQCSNTVRLVQTCLVRYCLNVSHQQCSGRPQKKHEQPINIWAGFTS